MSTSNHKIPVLYILDWNVGNKDDDPADPFKAGRVCVASATGGTLKTLIDRKEMPDGIEVLLNDGGWLIWTLMGHPDKNDGMIQRSDLLGSNITTLYMPGEIHTPKQVAVDQTNHALYVCDREGLRVHRSKLDGREKEVLVERGDWHNPEERGNKNLHCVGICVDPRRGKFYWTQKGPSKGGAGQIYRANMQMPAGETAEDRTDIELLFDRLPEPIDLAIDLDSRLLYWTDRGDFPKGNSLHRANISDEFLTAGEHQYSILARHLHEAIGLRLDNVEKHIYVTDLGGCVYRYNTNGRNAVKLFEGQGVYTGIALAYLSPEQAFNWYSIM